MSVYHGARSMEQSADIGESLVVLEKEREMEVKMDQQQEDETAPTTAPVTVAAAAGVDRTPVHVRNHSISLKNIRRLKLIYTKHLANPLIVSVRKQFDVICFLWFFFATRTMDSMEFLMLSPYNHSIIFCSPVVHTTLSTYLRDRFACKL